MYNFANCINNKKNRSNIASSILLNPELLENVYKASQNSDGSALAENEKYLDSISGKIQMLQNQIQKLAAISINNEALKTAISLLTDLLSVVTSVVDQFGALKSVVSIVGGAFATKFGFGKLVVYNAHFCKVA